MLHDNPRQLLEAYHKKWRWELLAIALLSICTYYIFTFFDTYETIMHFLSANESNFEFDEIFLCLIFLIIMLTLFSFRRWLEVANINRSLQDYSMFDELTGLLNRKGFEFLIKRQIKSAHKNQYKMALLFINLDNFKHVNNLWKHKFGDNYLKQTADQLQKLPGDDNITAHFGADEFVILLPNIASRAISRDIAEAIQELFSEPIIRNNRSLHISASIGISLFPDDGESATELIKTASYAMDAVKTSSGNDFRYYSRDIGHRVQRDILIENGLAKALDNNEFFINYQPIFEIKNRTIVALEALIRWQPPQEDVISPLEFIPIAEKTRQIVPIGKWVMQTACQQTSLWHKLGYTDISISVNVSPVQLHDKDFVNDVKQILTETGIPPQSLNLELTESIRIFNPKVLPILEELKTIGIQISIDDFGTGYCSFGYLKDFAINNLKIDKTLIDNIVNDSKDKAIAESIISMAHILNISVTAEGIEYIEQLQLLDSLDCNNAQGYLMSKPQSAEAISVMISSQKYFLNT